MRLKPVICISILIALLMTACTDQSPNDLSQEKSSAPVLNEVIPSENTGTSPTVGPNMNLLETKQELPTETEVDLSPYFEEFSGTAVFLNKSGDYTVYNKLEGERRVSRMGDA